MGPSSLRRERRASVGLVTGALRSEAAGKTSRREHLENRLSADGSDCNRSKCRKGDYPLVMIVRVGAAPTYV